MEIKMYNMEFGESILVRHEGNGILIDCGTDYAEYYDRSVDRVIRDLRQLKNPELMITHFHSDHINGLIKILDDTSIRFSRIYLPDIFAYADSKLLSLILLREYLENAFITYPHRYSVWSVLRESICPNNYYSISLVKAGDQFFSVGSNWNVLAPNTDDPSIRNHLDIFYNEIIGNLINVFENDISEPLSGILDVSRRIAKLFAQLEDTIQEDHITAIDQMLQDIFEIPLPMDETKMKAIRSARNRIHYYENKFSIVCSADLAKDKRTLFTGDSTKTILTPIVDQLADEDLTFYCVKASHHGTGRRHYTDMSPLHPQNIIISNGLTDNPNYRGPIVEDYAQNGNESCTNGISHRCQFVIKDHLCTGRCHPDLIVL